MRLQSYAPSLVWLLASRAVFCKPMALKSPKPGTNAESIYDDTGTLFDVGSFTRLELTYFPRLEVERVTLAANAIEECALQAIHGIEPLITETHPATSYFVPTAQGALSGKFECPSMTIQFRDDNGKVTLGIALQVLDGMIRAGTQGYVETANIVIKKRREGILVGKGGVDLTGPVYNNVALPMGTS